MTTETTASPADPRPESSTVAPVEELARAFKGMLAAVRRLKGRETHRAGGVSYAQYGLLFGLADGNPRSARELGELADLAPATVTQMLDHLAAAGLVIRVRSEEDKRVVLTSLTDRGRALIDAHRAQTEPRWRAAMSEFSDEELVVATAVLDRLHDLFDEFLDRPTDSA